MPAYFFAERVYCHAGEIDPKIFWGHYQLAILTKTLTPGCMPHYNHPMKQKISVKSYTFKFVLESDRFPDGRRAYHAYIPELESLGGATWGLTKEEAIRNLQDVARMVVEDLLKEQKSRLQRHGRISSEPLITVTA